MSVVACFVSQSMWLVALALFLTATPAAAEPSPAKVIHVKDYGALPGSSADSGSAIRKAIAAAVASGTATRVELDGGVYRIAPAEGAQYVFPIDEAKHLTIRGVPGKTELIVTDPRVGCFLFTQCRNVTLSGITIDYDPLPFTQGKVIAIDREAYTFDLAVDPGMPVPDAPWFATAGQAVSRKDPKASPRRIWGMFLDPQERRLKTQAHDHFFMESWQRVGDRTWRLLPADGYQWKLRYIEPGDRFVLLARRVGGAGVLIRSCTDVLVEDVTLHAAVSVASAVVRSENVALRRFDVRYRPDTKRLLTTNADGVHCQANRAGLVIENCFFEGMADDSINIYAPPNIVHEVVSETMVRVGRRNEIRPGDRLQIIDPKAGAIRGEVVAKHVETIRGQYVVTFDQPVQGIVAGKSHTDADTIYNLSACGAGYVIRNNTMRYHRRHGMLLRAGAGLVENNVIEGVAGHGIVVTNEPDWPEGPFARDITIRNNTIRGVGYARGYGGDDRGGAIQIRGTRLGHELATGRAQREIRLINNTIINTPGTAIAIGAAQDVYLAGNTISAETTAPIYRATAAIVLDNVDRTVITDCTITDRRERTTAGVLIRNTVATGPGAVVVKNLRTELGKNAVSTEDQRNRQ